MCALVCVPLHTESSIPHVAGFLFFNIQIYPEDVISVSRSPPLPCPILQPEFRCVAAPLFIPLTAHRQQAARDLFPLPTMPHSITFVWRSVFLLASLGWVLRSGIAGLKRNVSMILINGITLLFVPHCHQPFVNLLRCEMVFWWF